MHIMAASVHDRHRLSIGIRNRDFIRVADAGRFFDRQRVHVGRSIKVGPPPLGSTPTTPVLPTPAVIL
jgi:hypothetical protein